MSFFKKERPDFVGLVKKYAVASIILAVVGLAIGALFIAAPLASTAVIIWIALGLVALAGLVGVIRFIYPGKGQQRDGFAFTFGLLVIALFIVLLVCACFTPKQGDMGGFAVFSAGLVKFFSIFFGVLACFYSVWSLCMIGNVEKGKKGWVIFGDILGIVLGLLMIIFPFVYSMVAGIIVGVYVIIISISAIVFAIKALVAAHKAKKVVVDVEVQEEKK